MGHVSADLPVIDLTSPDIGATTKSIRQALMDHGFFYVINHGIDDALIKGVYAESKKFFEQPMEEKMALLMNSSHRGYIPPDFEGFEPDANGKGDLLESFHMFGSGVDSESKNDVNQWPPAERFPSWKETMKSYHECAMGTSKRILSLIALSLDLDAEFFKPDASQTILRPVHYSGQAIESKHGSDHGANPHTDFGMLTLVENMPYIPVGKAHPSRVANRDGGLGSLLHPGSGTNREQWGSTWPAQQRGGEGSLIPVRGTNRDL